MQVLSAPLIKYLSNYEYSNKVKTLLSEDRNFESFLFSKTRYSLEKKYWYYTSNTDVIKIVPAKTWGCKNLLKYSMDINNE